jgi:hypothetical protein
MVIHFLNSQSSLHYEFVPRGQILNYEICSTLLRGHQEQCKTFDRTLTGAQLVLSSRQRFRAHGTLCPELSKNKTPGSGAALKPRSLSSRLRFLFSKLKVILKGCGLTSVAEIQDSALEQLTRTSSKLCM